MKKNRDCPDRVVSLTLPPAHRTVRTLLVKDVDERLDNFIPYPRMQDTQKTFHRRHIAERASPGNLYRPISPLNMCDLVANDSESHRSTNAQNTLPPLRPVLLRPQSGVTSPESP